MSSLSGDSGCTDLHVFTDAPDLLQLSTQSSDLSGVQRGVPGSPQERDAQELKKLRKEFSTITSSSSSTIMDLGQ